MQNTVQYCSLLQNTQYSSTTKHNTSCLPICVCQQISQALPYIGHAHPLQGSGSFVQICYIWILLCLSKVLVLWKLVCQTLVVAGALLDSDSIIVSSWKSCTYYLMEWANIARWLGHQPTNQKVTGSIPCHATLVLLFPWTLLTLLQSTQLLNGYLVAWCQLGKQPTLLWHQWVPGVNWGSKCQTAVHVSLMGVAQVWPQLPTPSPWDIVQLHLWGLAKLYIPDGYIYECSTCEYQLLHK